MSSIASTDFRPCLLTASPAITVVEYAVDEGLYHLAMEAGNYEDFVDALEACSFNSLKTPDGVSFKDPKVNVIQINSDVFDF